MADLVINGASLAGKVSELIVLDGAIGGPVRVPTALTVTGAGGVFGAGVAFPSHRWRVGVICRGYASGPRETFLDEIVTWLTGLLEVAADGAPDRLAYVALAGRPRIVPGAGVYEHTDFTLELEFEQPDPTRYEREPKPIALSTSRTAIPVGPVPTAPRLWLYGASPSVVDPHVIIRSHTGEPIIDLALSVTLATNDALYIDAAQEQIDRYVAAVLQTGENAGLAAYASGYFPVLSADDSADDGSTWPTIELTATSGTPTGLLLHTRGY